MSENSKPVQNAPAQKAARKPESKPVSKYPVNMTDTPFPMRGDLAKLRDEEKYVDLPTLTAAIDNDAAQARAFFAGRSGALTATDRI